MSAGRLRARRAQLIADARALVKRDALTAEQEAQFATMMDEVDRLKGQIEREEGEFAQFATRMEAARGLTAGPGNSSGDAPVVDKLETDVLNNYLRGGFNALDSEEQRQMFTRRFKAAQSTGTDPAGGYLVAPDTDFYTRIIDAQKAFGGMASISTVLPTERGNDLPMPTSNDTANEGSIIGENTQVTSQDFKFGQVTLHAYTYTSKLVLVSNELLQDSGVDIGAYLGARLGTRIARAANRHFTTGSGSNQPFGVMTAATLGYTAGGSTSSGSVATVSYDDLVELEHSVDPAYRPGAYFMLSDAALKVIKKLKDGQGRPLWSSGLAAGAPDTIDGYPYLINQAMDVPAASAKSIAFGDFSLYHVRQVSGTRVLRLTERYADYNQTGFLAFQRWDGTLVDAGTQPVKYLQQSAT